MNALLDSQLDEFLAGVDTLDWSTPAVLTDDVRTNLQADAPVVAAVAAVLGLSVAVVAHICSVCHARSFSACLHAVKAYFGKGC